MTALYDNLDFNKRILLDLPFREGVGIITQDVAKPHHPMTMVDTGGGSFVWTQLANGLMVMQFNAVGGGAGDGVYMNSIAAATGDLNFTGDYSVGCWFNWDSTGGYSEILIGRYATDVDGWDCYLAVSGHLPVGNTLSQRHHHSSIVGNTNSQCYSQGWTPGIWHFAGISRLGASLYPIHYRNAVALTVSYEASGMLDPDTANRDLSIGVRGTSKDANWYRGLIWRPRVWPRALSQAEWVQIFERERGWFGL